MTTFPESSGLCLHVTRLTETDQVLNRVSLLDAGAITERLGVIDRQTCADVLRTVGAVSALRHDDTAPQSSPISASIAHLAADPIWRVRTRQIRFTPVIPATTRTEVTGLLAPQLPRLALKSTPAVLAQQRDSRHPLVVGLARFDRRASEIWEPVRYEVGARVMVRYSAECHQDWGSDAGFRGHHMGFDGAMGVIERRLAPDDPWAHHPYGVLFDRPAPCLCCGDVAIGVYLAPSELVPIDPADEALLPDDGMESR